jgi:phospholipid-binding lipoprotein MlaA
MMRRTLGAAALALWCSVPALAAETAPNPDPWESFNRKIFAFNDRLDRYFLKPVAKGYRAITPQFVDDSITNVLNNLSEPITIVNDLLQGKLVQSAQDTGRFVVNSTVGLVGIFDVGRHIKLPRHEEDFGQTLAKWGVPSGPYVVVPFMWGMTIRDGAGFSTDALYTGELYKKALNFGWEEATGLLALKAVDTRADLIPMEDSLQMQGDRYRLIRDALLQRREFLIKDGVIEADPFLDDDESYDEAPVAEVTEPLAESMPEASEGEASDTIPPAPSEAAMTKPEPASPALTPAPETNGF